MTAKLLDSQLHLLNLPTEHAKKESFHLGAEAIALLAKDPLIPSQYQNPESRKRLWQTLLEYDEQGRYIWSKTSDDIPNINPTLALSIN